MDEARFLLMESQVRELRHGNRNLMQTLQSLIGLVRQEAPAYLEELHKILDDADSRSRETQRLFEGTFEVVMDEQKQLRVVIVEDDLATRIMLRRQVADECGYAVVGDAADGEAMAALLVEQKPDVVIFDIHLPDGGDGLAIFLQAVETTGHPMVGIAVSGDSSPETIERANPHAVHEYLVKPVNVRQLRTSIQLGRAKLAHVCRIQAEKESAEGELEDRKTSERAKAKAMQALGIDEPTAMRALQKLASQLRIKLAQLSRQLIDGDSSVHEMTPFLPDEAVIRLAKRKIASVLRLDAQAAGCVFHDRCKRNRLSAGECARRLLDNQLSISGAPGDPQAARA